MSSSGSAKTNIEFLDAPEVVRAKIMATSCPADHLEHFGVLGLVRDVLFPISVQRVERLASQTGLNEIEEKGICVDSRLFCAENAPGGTEWTVCVVRRVGSVFHNSWRDLMV